MFRRLPQSLPKDFQIPSDLEQLGYLINENDQMRMTQKPEQKYVFRINRNDRVNDVYKEAVNRCVCDTVRSRLSNLGLETLRLPLGAKSDDRHVPIYVSNGIEHKKRVVVIFGERNQDPGIFSYRTMGEDGINVGSSVDLVSAIIKGHSMIDDRVPGILIANPGQLIWCRSEGRAISYREYLNLPRQSAVHGPFRIDSVKNRVPGNASYTEHVQYILQIAMSSILHTDAKLDIIGLEYTGDAMVHELANNWKSWSQRINGICLGNPQYRLSDLPSDSDEANNFKTFLSKRVRAYFVSDKPIEMPLPGREEHGCNCYSSGETMYEEGILVKSWRSMLDWFDMISILEYYEEPVFTVVEAS